MTFRPCAVVPSHNHCRAIDAVVSSLRSFKLPVYVVDDGSDEAARSVLAALHDPDNCVTVFRFDENQGKGAAVCQGFRMAATAGFSHVVQVDADGQHDLGALASLLDLAQRHRNALISGRPVYDASVPKARQIGRWLTHFWVWVETLSFRVTDCMCGFRVYPLAPVMTLLAEERVGTHMDFDIEIVVRLFWRGVPMVPVPVAISYPPDNTSNFDMLRDNWRITRLHTRLVFTMLSRIPSILRNRPAKIRSSRYWSALSERGVYLGLRLSAFAYLLLGRRGCMVILAPIVLYFFLTGTEQRRASRIFLTRAFAANRSTRQPGWLDGFRHFHSFAGQTVDMFGAWTGRLSRDSLHLEDNSILHKAAADPGGALFIVSHVGNADFTRPLLDDETRARLTVLVHTRSAENYNRVLNEFRPEASVNTLEVTTIGPEFAVILKERVERGEWVVIAGDRTPVLGAGRVSRIPFLGFEAPFPQGPFILAALLGCPVYTLFCLRDGLRYNVYCEKLADRIDLPRGARESALTSWITRFAKQLEHYALRYPFQWYNFFDFWEQNPTGTDRDADRRSHD